MIPTTWHSGKRQNCKTVKGLAVARIGEREEKMNKLSTKFFKAVKLFAMILWYWIHAIMQLAKPQSCTAQRVNYGLQLIRMYH